MENKNSDKYSGFFSKKLKAGKRRTYFFDVRSTKQGDFFLTITESKKKFDGDGYDSHKIFLYKEDFKKFLESLNETVEYIKTELMPDYDYDTERPSRPINTPNQEGSEESFSAEQSPEEPSTDAAAQKDSGATPVKPQIGDDEQIDWSR
ncbi:MAG: DUF3276 family protein [Bacteroidota bacterium]